MIDIVEKRTITKKEIGKINLKETRYGHLLTQKNELQINKQMIRWGESSLSHYNINTRVKRV